MTDKEIPLCKFWDAYNKNNPWRHFQSQFIYTCPQTFRDTYTYVWTTAQPLCKKQIPGKLDKAEGCLLAGRDHSQHSAHCPSHAWESPPGTCNRKATYQPQPFHACAMAHLSEEAWDPCLARTMLLPILLLVLWREEGKQTGHPWHSTHSSPEPSALLLSLERQQHARPLGCISGSATNVHHAAYSPTAGSIARSQLGREPECSYRDAKQAVPL